MLARLLGGVHLLDGEIEFVLLAVAVQAQATVIPQAQFFWQLEVAFDAGFSELECGFAVGQQVAESGAESID